MRFFVFVLFSLFICSCSQVKTGQETEQETEQETVLSVYEIAQQRTGVPSVLLQALAIVESNENDNAIGDDGKSIGRMQLNETFHVERAKKFGEYNPKNMYDATYIAGMIYKENLNILKDEYRAIAAYRQGIYGVNKYGADKMYINKVLIAMLQIMLAELKNKVIIYNKWPLYFRQKFGVLNKLQYK